MGIPRFYRWLSERYPLINELITAEQIPEFDNLYLDMNGIVHNCSHNNTGGLCVKDENEVFVEVFNYIVRLFRIIQPRKLFYLAVDGCAPRAKMNQQRSRRFRAANEAREAREAALEMGEEISGPQFDSNCITPGTEFMGKLTQHLQFFIQKQIQEDPLWQDVDVVLSGPDVPGEGEHKIMDYIRTAKAQPGYDPNLRHCLYGLDADLVMLALVSHEPHFALLREEVTFGKQGQKRLEQRKLVSKNRFQLLHISLVREYLDLEFTSAKEMPGYDLERIIDDFVLFCILVGNDFLPCLPFADIVDGGLDALIATYQEHLGTSREPWLVGNCGEVQFAQLAKYFEVYAVTESKKLEAAVDDESWCLGRRRTVGPQDAEGGPVGENSDLVQETPPTAELARVQYYEVKFDMDTDTHEGTQAQRGLFKSYLEGLQWVLFYYYRGPQNASWSWYYPFYHAPMIADLISYDKLPHPDVHFDVGAPFRPFQQLMAVLPSNSQVLLPECYRWLFDSPKSPISHFYPAKFQIDIDGVKVPWGGVTLIPFIQVQALLDAMTLAEAGGPKLSDAECIRNSHGRAHRFRYSAGESRQVRSSMPDRFQDLHSCAVSCVDYAHPAGAIRFRTAPPAGCHMPAPGFPTLALHPMTTKMETGIKVFDMEARGQSLVLHLHPERPLVPKAEEILQLLRAPEVLIDFPMKHRGKVAAVYTAEAVYLEDGQMRKTTAAEHGNYVWFQMEEWRKKGLAVDFEHKSEEEIYQHPIAEIRALESSFLDAQGQRHRQFRATGGHCSLHIVRDAADQDDGQALVEAAGALLPGVPVLCAARESDAFGLVSRVEAGGSLQATFRLGLEMAEQQSLESSIRGVVNQQHKGLWWYSLSEVAGKAQLGERVTRQIMGSILVRTGDFNREDIGLNFLCETWDGEVSTELYLPTYSGKWNRTWKFSDLAVAALIDYVKEFPGLFSALAMRNPKERDFEIRKAFPGTHCLEQDVRRLTKYLNAQPFKHLSLTTDDHMALEASRVTEVAKLVAEARRELAGRHPRITTVTAAQQLLPVRRAGVMLPPSLLQPADVVVGQRGFCIDPHATVPCGSQGTVIGVYGCRTGTKVLELLLDEETFGASDLKGRTPPMRGLQVPIAGFVTFSSSKAKEKDKDQDCVSAAKVAETGTAKQGKARPQKIKESKVAAVQAAGSAPGAKSQQAEPGEREKGDPPGQRLPAPVPDPPPAPARLLPAPAPGSLGSPVLDWKAHWGKVFDDLLQPGREYRERRDKINGRPANGKSQANW